MVQIDKRLMVPFILAHTNLGIIELFDIAEQHRVDLLNVQDGARVYQSEKLLRCSTDLSQVIQWRLITNMA